MELFFVFKRLICGIFLSEKGRNERILAEEYGKRKELEAQLEVVDSEHKIAAEKNSRMKEAIKVAEMKVAQIQAQAKMYEQLYHRCPWS